MIDRVTALCSLTLLFLASNFNAYADVVQIPLSGIGSMPSTTEMAVDPPIMKLGDVEIGSTKSQQFSITYNGDNSGGPAEIYSVEIDGEDLYDFNHDYNGYSTLETGQNVNFTVTFSPSTLGDKIAFLRVEHSGGNSPHIVVLNAKAIATPTSDLNISTTNLDFGSTDADVEKVANFTLTNSGSGNNYPAVNIYNVIISGDSAGVFTTDFNNVVTLNPGASIDVSVKLNSPVTGDKTAQISVEHDGENPALKVNLKGKVTTPQLDGNGPGINPEFLYTKLKQTGLQNPTSLQFGPDGKLYVSQQNGTIHELTVTRNGQNDYIVSQTNTINLIKNIQNHDDDGKVNNGVNSRLVTGILVAGSANAPELYVASSDPRMGAGPSGNDVNLDTNSVIISRLTKNGNNWTKQDLVRGLPRSEENHIGNGMQLGNNGNSLFIAMGGHTNMGVPSNNFAKLPEYSYSAAIVEVKLNEIGNSTYDLPTLDDEDRAGGTDQNDPFGGNNGKNMAILKENSPVQIYATGFRNSYDLVVTADNKMYTVSNGPNSDWGGKPAGNCLNNYNDGGDTYGDALHYIAYKGYYGGHPNPTRGNKNNTFNASNPQSPIEVAANPAECDYKAPGSDGALYVFGSSTNGLDEYTASNFGGAMKGDLLAASFNKNIYRIKLNNGGNQLSGIDKLFENLGTPLDVTSQGDNGIFPGTVWVADYSQNAIHVYEPNDY